MIKVSVIVAAYNVEQYIEKCIESLVNQTLDALQIIVVDDGSKDSTASILNKFMGKIEYHHKENGGLSDARNFGLSFAEGEYVSFVDGDDFCEVNMYEKLYEAAKKNNCDLVECAYFRDYENYSIIKYAMKSKDSKVLCNPAGQWNKLIRTEIINKNNLKFLKGIWYEDYNFNTKLIPFLKSNCVVDVPLYHYVQHSGSIMHSITLKIKDIYIATDDIVDFYVKNNLFEKFSVDLEYLICKEILLSSGLRCLDYDKKNKTHLVQENYLYMNGKFPNWKKNKFIKHFTIENLCMRFMSKFTVLFILHLINLIRRQDKI